MGNDTRRKRWKNIEILDRFNPAKTFLRSKTATLEDRSRQVGPPAETLIIGSRVKLPLTPCRPTNASSRPEPRRREAPEKGVSIGLRCCCRWGTTDSCNGPPLFLALYERSAVREGTRRKPPVEKIDPNRRYRRRRRKAPSQNGGRQAASNRPKLASCSPTNTARKEKCCWRQMIRRRAPAWAGYWRSLAKLTRPRKTIAHDRHPCGRGSQLSSGRPAQSAGMPVREAQRIQKCKRKRRGMQTARPSLTPDNRFPAKFLPW